MIPGIQDFYDGMNHHLIHEMEHALHDTDKSSESVPTAAPSDVQASDVHAGLHSPVGHLPSDASHVAHPDSAAAAEVSDHHEPDHGSHPALKWMGEAALELAAELATELIFSNVMVSASQVNHHDGHPLSVGVPQGDGFTHQTTGFTCAVVSQKMILDQFHLTDPQTGEPISEARLVYDATANGWLTDHGTGLADLSKLLEHYGVASHDGHDWKHLVHDLASGHQVVMAVNADELWTEHSAMSELKHLFGNSPNHALVLKGLKADDHGRVVIVVNDPGQADGAGVEYPLEHFQAAVDSTHMHYVATDHAPAGWSPEHAISQLAKEAIASDGDSDPQESRHKSHHTFADEISQMNVEEKSSFLRGI